MSQSPLARSSRRPLPRFAPTPSQLFKTTSSQEVDHASSSTSPLQNGYITPSKSSRDTTGTSSTPKLHYSPYANSSPHGGLSKSTSIPFDMAASARAARKTEQDKARGSSNGDGEYVEIPVTKKKRFVRRRSLWERCVSRQYP